MTPMPDEPKIVVLIDMDGMIEDVRSNIGSNLEVVYVPWDSNTFSKMAEGLPYTAKINSI